jgi:chromosome partitioning protein
MRIVALVNQKGGCGKTTTAIQIASRLAETGLRTLLVDLDPQAHASLGLGVDQVPAERGLARVLRRSGLDESAWPLREALIQVADHLQLAPSGVEMAELEPEMARAPGSEERLAEHLSPLTAEFDRVVIDAPPSLGLLTLNALMAADEVVVPVEPSLFALHGLARLVELMKLIGGHRARTIPFRVFLNAFDGRTRFARQVRDEIGQTFPEALLETTVRSSVCVREAAARGLPVLRFAARAKITQDYLALVEEIERGAVAREQAIAGTGVAGLVVGENGLYLTRRDVEPGRVQLAGDFNGWIPDAGVELQTHADGSWTKFVALEPGRYEYKLVVDGRWIADPLNPTRVPNDAGSMNSVLEVCV